MQRHLSIFLAGAIALSGAATSFTPAQAMPRMVPTATEATFGGLIEEVRCRRQDCWGGRRNWRPRHNYSRHYRSGNRYYGNSYYGDRHRHSGGAAAAGIIGFAAGAIIGGALSGGGYGSSYHGACAGKYRSYDPGSGTYLGYDGYRHRCVLR